MCVCVCERERERDRVCIREWENECIPVDDVINFFGGNVHFPKLRN